MIPVTGPIAFSQLQAEFGGSNPIALSQFYRGGGLVTPNNASVPASGEISLSQFRGAQKSVPGTQTISATGTTSVTLPVFSTLEIDVRGAGGGGGGSMYDAGFPGNNGNTGGLSRIAIDGTTIMQGNGGVGGRGANPTGANGANGTATGGDTNTTGGGAPGGAGGVYGASRGGNGGRGGRAVRTFNPGDEAGIEAGASITVVVGAGGAGGAGQLNGARGTNGSVILTWT